MNNKTIVTWLRIPVNQYGDLVYDLEEIKDIFEAYHKLYPEHQVFCLPDNINFWVDLDINNLIYFRDKLNEYIEIKEKENNDL